jgi:small subunit ribosomal protein S6e
MSESTLSTVHSPTRRVFLFAGPKIQRLVTPLTLQRKRARKADKLSSVLRTKEDAAAYKKVVAQRMAEQREARRSSF